MALDIDGDRKVEQVEDDVEFDPSVIPKRRWQWQEYEDKMEDQKNEKSEVQTDDKLTAIHSLRPTEDRVSTSKSLPDQLVDVWDTRHTEQYRSVESFPSDEDIRAALCDILESSDLMIVTRHQGKFEQGITIQYLPFPFFFAFVLSLLGLTSKSIDSTNSTTGACKNIRKRYVCKAGFHK
jgi:hypothetical protein